MCEVEDHQAKIKPWLRNGIRWRCGDAGDPSLALVLGPQDIVFANRFLCHMEPREAERCYATSRLVRPGGYLFVSGVDLDVRAKVACEMDWTPVPELLREVHEGDVSIRRGCPSSTGVSSPTAPVGPTAAFGTRAPFGSVPNSHSTQARDHGLRASRPRGVFVARPLKASHPGARFIASNDSQEGDLGSARLKLKLAAARCAFLHGSQILFKRSAHHSRRRLRTTLAARGAWRRNSVLT